MANILVCKNDNEIVIFNKGSKLVINIDNKLFNMLQDMTEEEILKWYQNDK